MKWLPVLSFNTNSIKHYSLNGPKYCYYIAILQLRHIVKKLQVSLCITNNSIKYQSSIHTVKLSNGSISKNRIKHQPFIGTQFKCQIVQFDP